MRIIFWPIRMVFKLLGLILLVSMFRRGVLVTLWTTVIIVASMFALLAQSAHAQPVPPPDPTSVSTPAAPALPAIPTVIPKAKGSSSPICNIGPIPQLLCKTSTGKSLSCLFGPATYLLCHTSSGVLCWAGPATKLICAVKNFLTSCKGEPTPNMPDSGFSGMIDQGPTDPATVGHVTFDNPQIYETIRTPPPWSVYGIGTSVGCPGSSDAPMAVFDTTGGNLLRGTATVMISASNSMHRLVSPPTFLAKFNPLLINGSKALRDAIFNPFIGITLLMLCALLIFEARKRNLPRAVEAVVWCLLVMGLSTALVNEPVRAGSLVDNGATAVISQVDSHFGPLSSLEADPASARGDLLVQSDLYAPWLIGELGSSTSTTAQRYGLALLETQSYSYAEAAQIARDPAAAVKLRSQKQSLFNLIAAQIATEDPAAYEHLRGAGGCCPRIAAGFMALGAAAATVPFALMSDLLIIVALIMIRLAVIFFPLIAVIGIFLRQQPLVFRIFNTVGGAVLIAIGFAIVSAFNFWAIGYLLGGTVGLSIWIELLICAIISWTMWKQLKPGKTLNGMVGTDRIHRGSGLRGRSEKNPDAVTKDDIRALTAAINGRSDA